MADTANETATEIAVETAPETVTGTAGGLPPQHQDRQPGLESAMTPRPESEPKPDPLGPKLAGKVALITGGDSGIGRAVALSFAVQGASIAIVYLDEHKDAQKTQQRVEDHGGTCLLIAGDVGDAAFCRSAVERVVAEYGRLDVLVNNAGRQCPQKSILDISEEQLEKTFRTNIFAMFFMVKAALPHLKPGARIINTTSVTAYRGSPHLLDYSATKGAIVGFTRSLAGQLVKQGIHVNAVAPGPVWTPLIPSTFTEREVAGFGSKVPMERAGQPDEIAPAFLFLATEGASFMTGQVLHPNGGEIVNG